MSTNPRSFLENLLSKTYLKDFNKDKNFLEKSLPLLLELEEVSESGIWYWDVQNNVQYWSDGYYKFMNVERRIGKFPILENFSQVNIHPDDIDSLCLARMTVIKEKKSLINEYRIINPDGSFRYIKSRMSVKLDEGGNLKFIVGLDLDVTATRSAIEELKEYKKTVTANEIFLGTGNWVYNIETKKIVLSDSLKYFLKYPDSKKYNELSLEEWKKRHLHNDDKNIFDVIYQSLLVKSVDIIDRLALSDFEGNEIIVTLLFKIMRNERGVPIKIIGTLKDVSELGQSERKLEIMVEELNRSNRELEEFAYIASHDLQEPIRKLITFTERINTMFSNEIPSSAKLYLDKISRASFNMKHLIENLLEFSRVIRTKTNFESWNLNELLEEVIQDFEIQIEETKTTLIYENLPTVEVVPYQVKQLFSNLIGNAIKFRKKDVLLNIVISHRTLSFQEIKEKKLNPKVNYLIINFKDNGIGFEQEYEDKIFQVFQRLNGKAEYPGTGIGLSICRKVMSFHNGFINVTSELGVGTTFHLILPYEQNKFRV